MDISCRVCVGRNHNLEWKKNSQGRYKVSKNGSSIGACLKIKRTHNTTF